LCPDLELRCAQCFLSWEIDQTVNLDANDFLMKYSAGVRAPRHMHSGDYYAVVVSGRFRHYLESENECEVLISGSAWFQKGNVMHQDSCVGPEDCILGIFWPQGFDVEFAEEEEVP